MWKVKFSSWGVHLHDFVNIEATCPRIFHVRLHTCGGVIVFVCVYCTWHSRQRHGDDKGPCVLCKAWITKPCNKDDMELFYGLTRVTIGNCNKASFWDDSWVDGISSKVLAPYIYVISRQKTLSVRKATTDDVVQVPAPTRIHHPMGAHLSTHLTWRYSRFYYLEVHLQWSLLVFLGLQKEIWGNYSL
jgi:hypothetical protein